MNAITAVLLFLIGSTCCCVLVGLGDRNIAGAVFAGGLLLSGMVLATKGVRP